MPKKVTSVQFAMKQPDLKSQGGKVSSPKSATLGSGTRKVLSGPDLAGGGWVKGGK